MKKRGDTARIHGFMNLRIREFYQGHKSGLPETQKINILLVDVPKTHLKIIESINFGIRESHSQSAARRPQRIARVVKIREHG